MLFVKDLQSPHLQFKTKLPIFGPENFNSSELLYFIIFVRYYYGYYKKT